ncbi:MAG: cadmium resistance transporter [Actinomycetales bacterium]
MNVAAVVQAVGLFAVTNVDDFVVLTLFFGRSHGGTETARIVVGQYVGVTAIVAASLAVALGARQLPASVIAYLGLLPLALGVHAAYSRWRRPRHAGDAVSRGDQGVGGAGRTATAVAAVTLANGGDNVGVYAPVLALASPAACSATRWCSSSSSASGARRPLLWHGTHGLRRC